MEFRILSKRNRLYISFPAPIFIHPWTISRSDGLSSLASNWLPISEPPPAFQHTFPNYTFLSIKMKISVTNEEHGNKLFIKILQSLIVRKVSIIWPDSTSDCNWNLEYFADINYEKLMKISHFQSNTVVQINSVFKNDFSLFLFQSLCSSTYTNKPEGLCGCLCGQVRVNVISNRFKLTLPGWVSLSQILCWGLGVS